MKLLNKHFPTELSNSSYFDPKFQRYIEGKLAHGAEIFLGVHNSCFTDMQCCLGETYNQFRESHPGKIHFYIQASTFPAFIYKGPYLPLMGTFALILKCYDPRYDWNAFTRTFSQETPSGSDLAKVRQAMQEVLQIRDNPSLDERIAGTFQHAFDRDKKGSLEDLLNYVNNPREYRLLVLPPEVITAQILQSEPGEERLPEIQSSEPPRPNISPISVPPTSDRKPNLIIVASTIAGIALVAPLWYYIGTVARDLYNDEPVETSRIVTASLMLTMGLWGPAAINMWKWYRQAPERTPTPNAL